MSPAPIVSPMTQALVEWVDSGLGRIGEIVIARAPESGESAWRLCHYLDAGGDQTPELKEYHRPEDAREIAKFDESGEYRPLKTAPNLRRGWVLYPADAAAAREALDYFYPAMIASWFHYRGGDAGAVPLRETLDRQTGMYRFARNIADEDARDLVPRHCDSKTGCLKKILWPLDAGKPLGVTPPSKGDPEAAPDGLADRAIPLLCREACNLVVAGARRVSKRAAEARRAAEGEP